MIANEEGVIRRDDVLIKNGERRFQLRRASREANERTFLRIFYKRALAMFERQRDGLIGEKFCGGRARKTGRKQAGGTQKGAAILLRAGIGRNWHGGENSKRALFHARKIFF